MSSSNHHHLLKRDSISLSFILTINLLFITLIPTLSIASPAILLPPVPPPEELEFQAEQLPTPASQKASQNFEKNICEAVKHRIFICNCDSYERPVDVTCFAASNSSSPLHPDWLDFSSQSATLGSSVTTFKLTAFQGNVFNYLPVSAINHLRPSLIKLTVSDLGLPTLGTSSISNFSELEEVEFQQCANMTLEERPFSGLPKLEKIAISDANIRTLKRLVSDVPALKDVYITKSGIQKIQVEGEGVEGAFTGMETCQYLDLNQNSIQDISQATFRGLRSLKEIELNRNSIRHLPAGTFAEMPLLTEIELNYNQIESVDPAAFAGLPRLQSLKLERNRLREFPAAGVFSSNRELAVVDIAFNYFDTVSWTVFYQPAAMVRYIRFRIQGNPIKCTCSIAWMSKALKFYDSLVEQELQTMDCEYPEDSEIFPENSQRPKSIYGFITSQEVAKNCKLPSTLIQASVAEEERKRKQNEASEEFEVVDDRDKVADKEKKILNEVTGNEVEGGVVAGSFDDNPDLTTPKVTRIYENEGGSGEVYQSPHHNAADNSNKALSSSGEGNTLNQAQFGSGNAAPAKAVVSIFGLIFALLCTVVSFFAKVL